MISIKNTAICLTIYRNKKHYFAKHFISHLKCVNYDLQKIAIKSQ